jgi:hypothetical protein
MLKFLVKGLIVSVFCAVIAPLSPLQAQTLTRPLRTIYKTQALDGWLGDPINKESSQASQVTSVSELRDVSPQD